MKQFILLLFVVLTLGSCTENYSNGERVGMITQFSRTGLIFKTWEGHLNMTQTGMNTSQAFNFSIDKGNERSELIAQIDSAATYGWLVKLRYHQVAGKNWFHNRGETDFFINECEVLDRGRPRNMNNSGTGQIVYDTIYNVRLGN